MLLTDFAYRSFSLLHGSVSDQSNGIFSTTRVLDGRDPGDIGHFLVAIRQWKPPTVKTIGKKKKKREIREELKVFVSLCLADAGYSLPNNSIYRASTTVIRSPRPLLPLPPPPPKSRTCNREFSRNNLENARQVPDEL